MIACTQILLILQDDFFEAVKEVLELARRHTTGTRSLPQPPSESKKEQSRDLHSLLRPFGDATDKLQAESITSNVVLLSVLSACKRK